MITEDSDFLKLNLFASTPLNTWVNLGSADGGN